MVNKNDLYALPADLQDKADAFKERYKALKAIDSRYAKMDLIEFFQSEDGKAIRQTKKDLRAQMYEDKAFLRRYLKSEKFIAEHTARARELMQVFTEKDLFGSGEENVSIENKEEDVVSVHNLFQEEGDVLVFNIVAEQDESEKTSQSSSSLVVVTPTAPVITEINAPSIILSPSHNTIADLQIRQEELPAVVKEKLERLEKSMPDCDFTQLTIEQLESIDKYVKSLDGIKNLDLLKLLEEYVTSAFNVYHPDTVYKKLDKVRAKLQDDSYIRGPLDATVNEFAQMMLQGMNKRHNILFLEKALAYSNPLYTMLVFIKVKQDIYPERTKEESNRLLPIFHDLIQSHTEGLLKMMFHSSDSANISLKKEFFGDKNNEISDQLKMLRAIMYNCELTQSITPRQQQFVQEIMNNYNETITIVLYSQPDNAVYGLYKEGVLERKKGNANMAYREIKEMFDEAPTSRTAFTFKNNSYFPGIAEMINLIYMKKGTIATNKLIEIGLQPHNLKEFVSRYLQSNTDERTHIRDTALSEFAATFNKLNNVIIVKFFDILNQYV